jgi:hypothetical protein
MNTIAKTIKEQIESYKENKAELTELCKQFDEGNLSLSKTIATKITNLFLETNSSSILQQLNIKSCIRVSYRRISPKDKILPNLESSLYQFVVKEGNELNPTPFLKDIKSFAKYEARIDKSINDYLSEVAICLELEGQKEYFSRKEIISRIRNEYESHSVSELNQKTKFLGNNRFQCIKFFQENIKDDGSFTLNISPQKNDYKNSLFEVCLRQIAFECLNALNNFEKTTKYKDLFNKP